MNVATGQTFPLPELKTAVGEDWWPALGELIKPSDLPSEGCHEPAIEGQLEEIRKAVLDHDEPIVMVSADVVQKIELGERELQRRMRRRGRARKS